VSLLARYNYHAKVTALLVERGAKLNVANSEVIVCAACGMHVLTRSA
jgi:hypothetical protein